MKSCCPFTNSSRLLAISSIVLASCGGSDAPPPVAAPHSVTMDEDAAHSGFLRATTTTRSPIRYVLSATPSNGAATIDSATGAFQYTPNPDYFGSDTFQFRASDGRMQSAPATVSIQVQGINDPPILMPILDLTNSPESREVSYQFQVIDVDGDVSQITATVEDEAVASVEIDQATRTLLITQLMRGTTGIRISAVDAQFSATQTFRYSVGDVTKTRTVQIDLNAPPAIHLFNASDETITLTLEHNGFPMFQSDEAMVEFVRSMPERFSDEPFQRKLWRFVRDNTYHHVPLSNEQWLYDPWGVINSQGWGFCGHVASAYVRIARAAGYEARVWGLSGHVVPEIMIDGRWEMYDPDLAVFYFMSDGKIAGVPDIVSDPSLITAPVRQVLSEIEYPLPYSEMIAGFYGSPANNYISEGNFFAAVPSVYQPVKLPPGSSLAYPGKWTASVIGVDGDVPYQVPYFLQSMLTVSSGWTGELVLPWMLWEIRGEGRVRLFDQEFSVGSEELKSAIQQTNRQIPRIEVLGSSANLEFIFFVNAMRYGLQESNTVKVTSLDAWAVDVGQTGLPQEVRASITGPGAYRKPTETL